MNKPFEDRALEAAYQGWSLHVLNGTTNQARRNELIAGTTRDEFLNRIRELVAVGKISR